jgi:hypothetical protein
LLPKYFYRVTGSKTIHHESAHHARGQTTVLLGSALLQEIFVAFGDSLNHPRPLLGGEIKHNDISHFFVVLLLSQDTKPKKEDYISLDISQYAGCLSGSHTER